jgi:two-component system CheB/CheR fusion protein
MADADQQKTNFLAVLAHELRNPLSALRMAADLLRRSPLGDRECRAVESIGRQLSQVDRLVKDLSDASLINQGKVVLERTDQKLAALVGAAVESVQECLRARQQQAEVNVPPDIVVHVDASRIVQVLTNLLHNASKFSPAGGVIRITAQGDAVQVAMKVEDAGAGIPHDRLEWIFDSYAQLNPAGGGLGLGLSLVRKLVVLHGGQVRALSRGPGQGSTFELTLPRVR